LGIFKVPTSHFENSVKYMRYTSRIIWGYFFFEFFFLSSTEIYHYVNEKDELLMEL
jgi:hypothetical protein